MKILLPIDGSEAALQAVSQVLNWMHAGLRAELVLANVQEPASLYEVVVAHDPAVIEKVRSGAADHVLAPAAALLRQADVPFESVVRTGDPGHVLLEIAEEQACDLIAIGARGVEVSGSGLLGPVAQAVLHHAQVPVLIVKLA